MCLVESILIHVSPKCTTASLLYFLPDRPRILLAFESYWIGSGCRPLSCDDTVAPINVGCASDGYSDSSAPPPGHFIPYNHLFRNWIFSRECTATQRILQHRFTQVEPRRRYARRCATEQHPFSGSFLQFVFLFRRVVFIDLQRSKDALAAADPAKA